MTVHSVMSIFMDIAIVKGFRETFAVRKSDDSNCTFNFMYNNLENL